MTINKELVREWVEALRSGKYEQGRKALRSKDNKFCCLGVLCDISKDKINLNWEIVEWDSDVYWFGDNAGMLPVSMTDYLNIDSSNVLVKSTNSKIPQNLILSIGIPTFNKKYISLITLNDQYKLSFSQIADIIEEEFLLSGTINENKTTDLA